MPWERQLTLDFESHRTSVLAAWLALLANVKIKWAVGYSDRTSLRGATVG